MNLKDILAKAGKIVGPVLKAAVIGYVAQKLGGAAVKSPVARAGLEAVIGAVRK